MGKTKKDIIKRDSSDYKKLQIKYENRRLQIKRLKKIILLLEKKLEKYEVGIVGTSDKGKPEKKIKSVLNKKEIDDNKRKELLEKLRAEFVKPGTD
jgi:hypothetical protein